MVPLIDRTVPVIAGVSMLSSIEMNGRKASLSSVAEASLLSAVGLAVLALATDVVPLHAVDVPEG